MLISISHSNDRTLKGLHTQCHVIYDTDKQQFKVFFIFLKNVNFSKHS